MLEPAVGWHEGNAMALPFADQAFDAMIADVNRALAPYVQAGGLLFPLTSNLILGRA